MIINKLNKTLILVLLFIIALAFYYILIYPSYSDFDFWSITQITGIQNNGTINLSDSNPGFEVLCFSVSSIMGINLQTLYLLPIQMFIFIIIFGLIVYEFIHNFIIAILIAIVSITSSLSVSAWAFSSHPIGFILLFIVLCLIILELKTKDMKSAAAYTALMITTIFVINFISYKAMFAIIALLLGLFIIKLLINNRYELDGSNKPFKSKLSLISTAALIIVGLAFIFIFNKFFYNVFLPELNDVSNFSNSSAIDKLFSALGLNGGQSSSATALYSNIPTIISYVSLIRFVILAFLVIIFLFYIIRIYIRKDIFSLNNQLLMATLFAGFAVLAVYVLFGILESTLISYVALILIGLLCVSNLHKFKYIGTLLIILLILSNCIIAGTALNANYQENDGVDVAMTCYETSTNWIINHAILSDESISSDVFTAGYINYIYSEETHTVDYRTGVITADDIQHLIGYNETSTLSANYYVINNDLNHFSIMGWETYNSWEKIGFNKTISDEAIIYSGGGFYVVLIEQ